MADLVPRVDGLTSFYNSLSNPWTGQGTTRDKGMGFEVSPTYRIDLHEAVWLYRDNWLLQRAVDLLPKEATREWFEWKLGDAPPEVWAGLDSYLRRLEARSNFREAVRSERHYGGCGMLVGVDDGQSQDQPINLDRIRSVTFLQPLDRHRIYPELTTLSNPLKPEYFTISDSQLLRPDGQPLGIRVHRSRVLIFPGIGDWNVRQQNGDGWGDSILQAVYNSFVRFFGSLGAVSSTIQDFSVFMLAISGLREILMAPNGEEKLRALVELNDRARSVHKLVVTDAQREKMSELSRSLGGVEPILAFMKEELTAAAGVAGTIPATILWGQSPAGENATGESDRFAFAQSAHQLQEDKIRAPLEWLTELIFRAKDGPTGGRIPEDWTLDPVGLYQRSQKEILEERRLQAEIDERYLTLQVLKIEEVRQARFGQAEYSHETVLLEEMEEPPAPIVTDAAERLDDATPVKRVIEWNGFKIGLQYLPFQLRHKKVLPVAYGHLQKTRGADGMALDCYVHPDLDPEHPIFAIQQLVNGEPDEEKIMLGFASAEAAQETFEWVMAPEMFGSIRELSLEQLRQYQTAEATRADAYDKISFKIPESVQKAAQRGLDLRKEHGRGGTSVGLATARLLAKGGTVSPQKARHIAKYFPRHEVDKQGKGWGDRANPSNGYIAWLLWGGDPGRSWSSKLVRQMEAADSRGDADKLKVGQAVSWQYAGSTAHGKVKSVHPSKKTLTIEGSKITRNGTEENPAVVVEQEDGSRALKLASELKREARKDATEKLQIEGRVLTEAEFDQMSEIVASDIQAALADWRRSAPERWSELLEAEAYADPDAD